jgi:D-glycero-alpha-D-manno-heptose 1-phosphate guanylyltransferase
LINGGIYMIERDIVRLIPEGKISFEGHVLPLIKEEKLLYGKVFDAFFLDIGLPADYHWIDNHAQSLQ